MSADSSSSARRGPMGGRGPMGHGGGGPVEKPKNFKATFHKLLQYLGKHRITILIVLILAVFSATFSILGPKVLGWGMTKLVEGLMAWQMGTGLLTDFDYIGKCVFGLLILYLISALCAYVQNFIMSKVSMKVTYQLRKELSEKVNRLPLKYFDQKTHGEVLFRILTGKY